MTAVEKVDFANNNTNKIEKLVGEKRGLNYEEKLLFEQSSEGSCGVDFPEIENLVNRTGQQERAEIGLPQVTEPTVVRHFVRL